MLSSQTSPALLLALLSLASSAVIAQSACGLVGYSSCTDTDGGRTTGYGCCPTGWDCYATECSQTAPPTSAAPTTTKTECPGVPAHHLCPMSLGGNCCYGAYACDPANSAQCVLTKTERVFDEVKTTTTVVGDKTETITKTSYFYPWQTVEARVTPKGDVPDASSTTKAPDASGKVTTPASSAQVTTSAIKAAAGRVQAAGMGVGGVIGGIAAAILV